MCYLISDFKHSSGEFLSFNCTDTSDCHITISKCTAFWPVWSTHFLQMIQELSLQQLMYTVTNSSILHDFTKHYNRSTMPLMYHFPEIPNCSFHGRLCYNESSVLLVSLYQETFNKAYITDVWTNLKETGIYILWSFISENNSSLFH